MKRSYRKLAVLTLAGGVAAGAVAVKWLRQRWSFPVRKREIVTGKPSEEPPIVPANLDYPAEPMFLTREGTGPLFYRRYRADIATPALSAEALMQRIQQNIDDFAATELATFEKTLGEEALMQQGDEFYIRISGPWNGHVRTVDVTPTSFTFVTLAEHLERGEIHFSIEPHPTVPDALRFEISSWARSNDELVSFVYDTLGIAKLAQESLWAFFCNRVVEASGGQLMGEIDIRTEKSPYRGEVIETDTPPAWKQYQPYFDRFNTVRINYEYDPETQHEYTEADGWLLDAYKVELLPEVPGEPTEGGSWRIAQEVIRNYEFPDPDLVTGIFIPDDPLDQRLMIIRGRFWWWTFYFGVRINRVLDEIRQHEGEEVHVWGYSYQTLEGHFEAGEITFEVWKYAASGRVEFHINAYSKPAHISNIFYRIGFRLFGRGLQKHFADSSLKRMVEFVETRSNLHPAQEEPEPAAPIQSTEALPEE